MSVREKLLANSPSAQQRKRALRRGFGVHFYSGRNGTGKSALCVFDTMPDLDMGRTVLSTVRLLDYGNPRPCEGWWGRTEQTGTECPICSPRDSDGNLRPDLVGASPHGQAHPAYVPFTRWPQLLEMGPKGYGNPDNVKGAICVMDEVTGVADSSEGGMPAMVYNELAQLRRAGVVLRLTGLDFIRAHKRIREATVGITRCESFMPITVAGEESLWRPRQLSVARTYYANSLPKDDITDAAWENAELVTKAKHWIPTWEAITAYDTLAPVDRVGTVTDAGACAYCAGARRRHECNCDDYQAEKLARKESLPPPARRAAPRTVAISSGAGSLLAVTQ